ncbi:MAG: HAD family hydrolase [Candidatus Altiarchaeota archaeon]
MEIKAVLFDLWHTLTFHDKEGVKETEGAIIQYLQSFNPEVLVEEYCALRKKYHNDITTGRLSLSESNKRVLEELNVPHNAEDKLTELIETSIRSNMRVYEGVDVLLTRLRDLGLKLGLVTNCGVGTMDLLREVGLDVFDSYAFSNEIGVRKPDSGIYLKVSEELRVDSSECVFVSDEIYEDLVGAKRLGMKTIHVRRKERDGSIFEVDPDERIFEPDASVDKVADVYKVIKEWLNGS